MLMKTGILYFTTCFHGFGILRHVDPFVRMPHKYQDTCIIVIMFYIIYMFSSWLLSTSHDWIHYCTHCKNKSGNVLGYEPAGLTVHPPPE